MIRYVIPVVLGLTFGTLPVAAFGQSDVEDRLSEGQPPVVIAHRSGEMGGAPENSLAAIRYAVDRGIDMVHLNVQVTSDGRYVLMHDATLNRTTDVETVYPDGPPGGPSRESRGGRDYVRDYTLDDIRKLRVTEDGQPVPTLDEALDLAAGRVMLFIGLKNYEEDSLISAFDGRGTGNLLLMELYVPGTDQNRVRALSEATGIAASLSFMTSRDGLADLERVAEQLGQTLRMVCLSRKLVTAEFLARADELGVAVCVSGWKTGEDYALVEARDPGPWRSALESGAVAFSTDQPDALLMLLGR